MCPNLVATMTLIALARERGAEARLAQAVLGAVDVGGVEEGDAGLDRGVDHRVRALLLVGRGAGPTEVVAAEADHRDGQIG